MRSDPSQYFPESTRQLFIDYGDFTPPPDPNSIQKEITYSDISVVEERIGRGGFGVVHHGRVHGRDIALKEPRPDRSALGERFVTEAQFWEGLTGEKSPPFLVDCHAWGTEPHPWICMEYLPHGTLGAYLREYMSENNALLSLDTALWMATVVARGVEYTHSQGLTHRDLKPDNILLEEIEGFELPYPQISDWGLAIVPALADGDDRVLHPYAAPEQLDDPDAEITKQEHGEGIDIYQLGLITHFLLTGDHPIDAPSRIQLHDNIRRGRIPAPSDERATIPDEIDKVVMKAVSRQRTDRYQNAGKYRERLESLFRSCLTVDNIRMERVDYHRSATTATAIGPSHGTDPTDLRRDWQFELESPTHAPLVWTNLLCVPEESQLEIRDVETGDRAATVTFPHLADGDVVSGIAFDDGKLYVLTEFGRLFSARGQREIATVHSGGNGTLTVGPGTEPDFFITQSDGEQSAIARVRSDGSTAWRCQFTSPTERQPPVYVPQTSTVFVASVNGLLELDATSGANRLYGDIQPPTTPLSLYQNYIYYGADVGGDTRIICVNINTEHIEWTASLDTPRNVSGLAVTNNVVVATTYGDPSNHGRVVCCERTNGTERWRFTFGNQSLSPPAVDQNHACVGLSIDIEETSIPEYMHDIYCFDLESGAAAYRARTDSGTPRTPILRDGRLVAVTSQDVCVGFTST